MNGAVQVLELMSPRLEADIELNLGPGSPSVTDDSTYSLEQPDGEDVPLLSPIPGTPQRSWWEWVAVLRGLRLPMCLSQTSLLERSWVPSHSSYLVSTFKWQC